MIQCFHNLFLWFISGIEVYDWPQGKAGTSASEILEVIEERFNVKCINTIDDIETQFDRTQRYFLEFETTGDGIAIKFCYKVFHKVVLGSLDIQPSDVDEGCWQRNVNTVIRLCWQCFLMTWFIMKWYSSWTFGFVHTFEYVFDVRSYYVLICYRDNYAMVCFAFDFDFDSTTTAIYTLCVSVMNWCFF